jgi:hypothetical protein
VGLNNPTIEYQRSTGTYTGTDAANRAIAHGLGIKPKLVLISARTLIDGCSLKIIEDGRIEYLNAATDISYAVTAFSTNNFYVGNAASWPQSGNGAGVTYNWVAFG